MFVLPKFRSELLVSGYELKRFYDRWGIAKGYRRILCLAVELLVDTECSSASYFKYDRSRPNATCPRKSPVGLFSSSHKELTIFEQDSSCANGFILLSIRTLVEEHTRWPPQVLSNLVLHRKTSALFEFHRYVLFHWTIHLYPLVAICLRVDLHIPYTDNINTIGGTDRCYQGNFTGSPIFIENDSQTHDKTLIILQGNQPPWIETGFGEDGKGRPPKRETICLFEITAKLPYTVPLSLLYTCSGRK